MIVNSPLELTHILFFEYFSILLTGNENDKSEGKINVLFMFCEISNICSLLEL